eukprot:6234690-Prymnesium_polylepis.1
MCRDPSAAAHKRSARHPPNPRVHIVVRQPAHKEQDDAGRVEARNEHAAPVVVDGVGDALPVGLLPPVLLLERADERVDEPVEALLAVL